MQGAVPSVEVMTDPVEIWTIESKEAGLCCHSSVASEMSAIQVEQEGRAPGHENAQRCISVHQFDGGMDRM